MTERLAAIGLDRIAIHVDLLLSRDPIYQASCRSFVVT